MTTEDEQFQLNADIARFVLVGTSPFHPLTQVRQVIALSNDQYELRKLQIGLRKAGWVQMALLPTKR